MRNAEAFCILHLALNRRSLRILQREPQLLRQRIDRRAGALPLPFGLEPEIADAAAPRRDDAADGAEIAAVRVLLIEAADDVGRDAAALRAFIRVAPDEDQRDLLEVVHEKLQAD